MVLILVLRLYLCNCNLHKGSADWTEYMVDGKTSYINIFYEKDSDTKENGFVI